MQVSVSHEETKDDHVFLSTMPESGMIIKNKREKVKVIWLIFFLPANKYDTIFKMQTSNYGTMSTT